MNLVLTNAQVVTRGEVMHGSVAIEGTRIAAVDSGSASGIDLENDLLIPGLIEVLETGRLREFLEAAFRELTRRGATASPPHIPTASTTASATAITSCRFCLLQCASMVTLLCRRQRQAGRR